MSRLVNVKWSSVDKYISKYGTYRNGEIKPMPELLAKEFESSKQCTIVKDKVEEKSGGK